MKLSTRRVNARLGVWRRPPLTGSAVRPLSAWLWMLLTATAAVSVAWLLCTWLLGIASRAGTASDRATERIEAVRTGLAAGAGVGGSVGLMLAFRRQRHQEIATASVDHDATERRITELYIKAADQLGSDKAAVRLAGLYALERLGQDHSRHRQMIVNVICAYLRMPLTPRPQKAPEKEVTLRSHSQRSKNDHRKATIKNSNPPANPEADDPQTLALTREEEEVRMTAQQIIATHLRRTIHDTSEKDSFGQI